MTELRATLRLQFHRDFTLDDAVPLVGYFARLGISHVYASPLLTARTGSRHGYDVVDPTQINPELGGETGLRRLVEALREHGMGLILDIVSNHMAVGGGDNPWWLDVLEWGAASPYAAFFDIQWQSQDPLMDAQLLVPFLRSDYGDVLDAGEILLHFDGHSGGLYAQHFDHRFPLTPPSYADVLACADTPALHSLGERFDALGGDPDAVTKGRELRAELARRASDPQFCDAVHHAVANLLGEGHLALHRLLERQHYRLASWRTAADDINWRRFFDINELGGLRVERAAVFDALHAKVFALIEEGLIDGLRIDHVDGLANPRAYCRKLRRSVERVLAKRPTELHAAHFPIYVEKILGEQEQLASDWGVDGTTGYEFMNQVSLLQHDPLGELHLHGLWNAVSGRPANFREEVLEARQLVLTGSLAGDLENVAQGLLLLARTDLATRDFTLGALRRALLALIVHFPVYRTYATASGRAPDDQAVFRQALAGASDSLAESDRLVLPRLDRWLGGQPLRDVPLGPTRHLQRKVLVRFQQLTSPAAAKAVEDTACYRAGVLLSRYDVGFDPQRFSAPAEAFHRACRARAQRFPHNLLATATHDHKRGEDTRARLAVLSERSHWYAERLEHWRRLAAPLRSQVDEQAAPSPGDEALLYQTLLASWPLGLSSDDRDALHSYRERLQRWQEKALREAKLHSTWNAPNGPYEDACRRFLEALLEGDAGQPLRDDLAAAAAQISPAGALNGLAQCLLKLTSPGVPDFYQGCEFWDFSLVDPDNRRPVDFAARQATRNTLAMPAALLRHWTDGHIKQWLIIRLLALRAEQPALFATGDFRALAVEGAQAERVLAFARRLGEQCLIVVVPRLSVPLLGDTPLPHIPPAQWGDTRIVLPTGLDPARLRGLCRATFTPPAAGRLAVAELLADCPVNALLTTPAAEEPRHDQP
ncbi:malto-oligosyltrehalose synthase [Pseudomonas sp. UL073]|uniref:Malto-oligosyltrehalose synthase n=1 Tax=Zestomonas insulae TaxID=2809017 RepID=A0ABS2IFM6_9GAMM|nr:malto-oligosyltrehalose synthase [Pseudomonas insulae]MBM7061891.1 malto-oligosyltrehalose synthase [Pseudomonas insulae]